MKPFNLERALAGDPVCTELGVFVKIAGFNPNAHLYQQLAGWVDGYIKEWSKNGEYGHNDPYRLFMAPTERKEWVVRVANPSNHIATYLAGPFKTLEAAKDLFNTKREGWASIHEITIIE
jgi:hypothetical protein